MFYEESSKCESWREFLNLRQWVCFKFSSKRKKETFISKKRENGLILIKWSLRKMELRRIKLTKILQTKLFLEKYFFILLIMTKFPALKELFSSEFEIKSNIFLKNHSLWNRYLISIWWFRVMTNFSKIQQQRWIFGCWKISFLLMPLKIRVLLQVNVIIYLESEEMWRVKFQKELEEFFEN